MRQKRKPNIRSFRYSNECADILATYGNDLDAFVLDAYLRLPETHEQVRMELEMLRELESEAHHK